MNDIHRRIAAGGLGKTYPKREQCDRFVRRGFDVYAPLLAARSVLTSIDFKKDACVLRRGRSRLPDYYGTPQVGTTYFLLLHYPAETRAYYYLKGLEVTNGSMYKLINETLLGLVRGEVSYETLKEASYFLSENRAPAIACSPEEYEEFTRRKNGH